MTRFKINEIRDSVMAKMMPPGELKAKSRMLAAIMKKNGWDDWVIKHHGLYAQMVRTNYEVHAAIVQAELELRIIIPESRTSLDAKSCWTGMGSYDKRIRFSLADPNLIANSHQFVQDCEAMMSDRDNEWALTRVRFRRKWGLTCPSAS